MPDFSVQAQVYAPLVYCFAFCEILYNGRTLVTVLPSKSAVTSTLVVSVSVAALGSILTRIGGTFVYI